jgi:hypothetical protein
VANYAIGWAYDEVTGSHDPPAAVALDPADDPHALAQRPALRGQPGAEAQLVAYGSLVYEYRPFLMEQLVDGTYGDIVIDDHLRRTYEPVGLTADSPEIWIFGGSTVFGKGQRDDHTIASELARLADDAGTPARVLNFGNPGYTSYQEWQVFERELATGRRPAVAVFLDGTADLEVQAEAPSPDPTHFNRERVDQTVTGERPAVIELGDLPDEYFDSSFLGRLWRRAKDVFAIQPAAAAEPSIADNAADLGLRARRIEEQLARRDDVRAVFAREPTPAGGPTRSAYEAVTAGLPEDTLDLSGLLDGRDDLYLDWIHVDEAGARLIAEALFDEVEDSLA